MNTPRAVGAGDAMSEAQLLTAVLAVLRRLPHVHGLRLNSGATVIGEGASRRMIKGCEAGTPDVLVLLSGGRVVWLELKSPRGRIADSQSAWHAMAAKLGHRVVVCRDVQTAIDAVAA